jgi:hypothetical protein
MREADLGLEVCEVDGRLVLLGLTGGGRGRLDL